MAPRVLAVNAQPTLTTTEVSTSPAVAPASFTDSATLSGLNEASSAAGTVTYNLYTGTSSTSCTGTPLQSVAKTVAGGVVSDGTFSAVAAGNYEMQTVYSVTGGTFNLGATSVCGTEAFMVVNAAVSLSTTEVSTSPAVAPASFTDSATLSGLNEAGSAAGTVTYNLYAGTSSTSCTGTPLQSLAETVAGGVVTNATFTSVGPGTYEIQAVYSGDSGTSNPGATSACGAEGFTVNAQSAIATTEVSTSPAVARLVHRLVNLERPERGRLGGGDGHVQPVLGHRSTSCTGTPVQSVGKSVAGGVVPNATFSGIAAGSYEIQTVYSGDNETLTWDAPRPVAPRDSRSTPSPPRPPPR